MAEEELTNVIQFLKLIRSEKEVSIQFIKKDGNRRSMKCTLDFEKIPKEKRPKGIDLPKILAKIQKIKMLSVFDTEKQDWRTVPFNKLEFLVTPSNKKVFKLRKIK